jgi:N-acetylglucosaminyldiphosphoundecaprenol N-acetyl-beta-D-mannosaminyltransferase
MFQIELLPRDRVGDVPFVTVTLREAASAIVAAALDGNGYSIRFANAYCVVLAAEHEEYRSLLQQRGINFADGAPVARILQRRAQSRESFQVRGPSCFTEVLRQTQNTHLKHVFLSPDEKTAAALEGKLAQDLPDLTVSAVIVPPFLPPAEMVPFLENRLSAIEYDFVWVGLGSPKQDEITTALATKRAGVFLGVGAAISFFAGTVAEAPSFIRKAGLEWLFRLMTEPRRLWRRYLLGNARFIWYTRHDWRINGREGSN